jgi:hypothetical protein
MKSRSNILKYSKRQEERLIRKLENLGVVIIKHYGDREKNAGDVLCDVVLQNQSRRYRIDHKSTQSPEVFTLKERELLDLTFYCGQLMSRDGVSYAAISINWYDREDLAIVCFDKAGLSSGHVWRPSKRGKNIQIKYSSLENLKGGYGIIYFHEYTVYVYRLAEWVFNVKANLM